MATPSDPKATRAKTPRSPRTTKVAAKTAATRRAPRKTAAKAKPADRRFGVRTLAAGAAALGLAASLTAAFFLRSRRNPAEHAAPDLALDAPRPGTDRAPEAFRPDPTAVPTKAERESLRPATGHAPGFAADRGTTIQ